MIKTFASLPDTYKLLTFHVTILLQSPTNDVKTPAPHAFHSGCSRLMTVRQRLLPHAHHTGPDLEPYLVKKPLLPVVFLYLTFS